MLTGIAGDPPNTIKCCLRYPFGFSLYPSNKLEIVEENPNKRIIMLHSKSLQRPHTSNNLWYWNAVSQPNNNYLRNHNNLLTYNIYKYKTHNLILLINIWKWGFKWMNQ